MMKKQQILALICLLLLLPCFVLPVSANSAQKHWYGTDASGAIITGGESPIVVESELLTFNIPEFPYEYYNDQESFSSYSADVSAEYTFYNPSDMTVTATLAFPYGTLPSYAGSDATDEEKYSITVNGEEVETRIRYTLSNGNGFDIESDLPLLADDYISSGIYSPDTRVTVYSWNIEYRMTEETTNPTVACDVGKSDGSRVIYLPRQKCGHIQDNGDMRIGTSAKSYSAMLCVIGEPLQEMPTWRVYKNAGCEDSEALTCSFNLKGTESMTLLDFALANRGEDSPVSEIDWYNTVISEMIGEQKDSEYPVLSLYNYEDGYSNSHMRWFQYDITLAPGERLVNRVTAPMYPDINRSYVPTIYNYTYLLSPASTWADFGELKIIINTPYFLTESNIEGFNKTEGGYELTLDGLPKDEEGKFLDLKFTLSTEENPVPESKTPGGIAKNIVYFILFCWPYILIGLVVLIVLVIIIKRRR